MSPRIPYALAPIAAALSVFAGCSDPKSVAADQPQHTVALHPASAPTEAVSDLEKGGPIESDAPAAEPRLPTGPQAWTMNWFRSPTINGRADCVPTDYGVGDIRRAALGSDPKAKFAEENYIDHGVLVHTERVSYSSGMGYAFVSVSDYDYCIRNYQKTYWRMAAAFADEPRPQPQPVVEPPPRKPRGRILLYPDGTEIRTDGDGTSVRPDPDGTVTVTHAPEASPPGEIAPSRSDD